MKNPWQTLSVLPVYQNRWISLEEHQVINPKGGRGIYGKVHFKNIALGIIPLDESQNTWLVGQYRYTLEEYSWEIPMGGGSLEVDPLESAKRELKEETGLIAANWNEILKIHTSNSVTDEVGFAFLATGLSQQETEFDETEDLIIRKLPFEAAFEMVMAGKITDSMSIAAILKLKLMLTDQRQQHLFL
jgi:8-oxo-dGTP pyrophosphatase MutT (NUDIX family)